MTVEMNHPILISGEMPDVSFEPSVSKQRLQLSAPSIENPRSYEQLLEEACGQPIPLQILQAFDPNAGEWTQVFFEDDLVGIENGDTEGMMYGLAVDIGTTTVVATLVDLHSGRQVASAKEINPQIQYGQEVISRISYVIVQGRKGLYEEQAAILTLLDDLIHQVCSQAQIDSWFVYEIVVAANPTMTHLLLGIDPRPIGKSPYVLVTDALQKINAQALGLENTAPSARLIALPSVSSYIGSDIVGGIYASMIHESPKRSLLIDIGTNGEMVLADDKRLIACSAAAGPALEGMMMTSGMKAADGAIEEVTIHDDQLGFSVIGQKEALGICGSGILAAVREFIAESWINKRGRLVDPANLASDDPRSSFIFEDAEGKRYVQLANNILMTQKDIRHVQLAKSAILAGIRSLLKATAFKAEDIDEVFVAGQFGHHVSEDSLVGTGLFPQEFRGKIRYIGNASHSGAYLALISQEARSTMSQIARQVDYVELSTLDNFEKIFARSSRFPDPSEVYG